MAEACSPYDVRIVFALIVDVEADVEADGGASGEGGGEAAGGVASGTLPGDGVVATVTENRWTIGKARPLIKYRTITDNTVRFLMATSSARHCVGEWGKVKDSGGKRKRSYAPVTM
jgi:hypothetical protein